ncbi:MAG: hypothetical protein JNJ54_05525 [Myxococcaceae bacterium]|nr:hypothetical protein [Myxococcaceae bacterium]
MPTDTASLPTICAACRSPGSLQLEQSLEQGVLRWAESFTCTCGHGFEAKNAGLPMPAARQALMVAHGKLRVFVDAMPKGGRALSVLAKVLDAPEAEVASALGRLPALVWEGTRAEASFMRQALEKSGATVRVETVAMKAPAPRPSAKRGKKK